MPKFLSWASRVGVSRNGSRACGTPPRPPADPPHKGGGFNFVWFQPAKLERSALQFRSYAIACCLKRWGQPLLQSFLAAARPSETVTIRSFSRTILSRELARMSVAIGRSTGKARTSYSSVSRPRQKSLAGVGHENADTDHAKQCGNDLDHDDGPLRPARTKRHGRPNSQKNSVGRYRIAARLMISGNRGCRIVGRIAVELRCVASDPSAIRPGELSVSIRRMG
jgi:hypothetical protein